MGLQENKRTFRELMMQQTPEPVWQLECKTTLISYRNSLSREGKNTEAAKKKHPNPPPPPPLVVGCSKGVSTPCCFLAGFVQGVNHHYSSHCVNMSEEESHAVTADGVKTLTTIPWSWFMQSIRPITGEGLMPLRWNGRCLFYLFIYLFTI